MLLNSKTKNIYENEHFLNTFAVILRIFQKKKKMSLSSKLEFKLPGSSRH